MNVRIVAGGLLFVLLLAGCAGADWIEVENGATLELQVGETRQVALDTFGGAPFHWQHEGFDAEIVQIEAAGLHFESTNPAPGEKAKAVFEIRGLKAGETEITFVFSDFDDVTDNETRTLAVVVH